MEEYSRDEVLRRATDDRECQGKDIRSQQARQALCFLYSLVLFNTWILANARLANILQMCGSSDNTIAHENCHTDGRPLEERDSTRTPSQILPQREHIWVSRYCSSLHYNLI